MYIKTNCTKCGNADFHDIAIDVLEHIKIYSDSSQSVTNTIEDAEVCDTVSEEELARHVINELRPFMHDGMTTDEFCKILKKYYGVASKYCCDLIQRMKIELGMYCPDRQHLYFV